MSVPADAVPADAQPVSRNRCGLETTGAEGGVGLDGGLWSAGVVVPLEHRTAALGANWHGLCNGPAQRLRSASCANTC